MSPNTNVASTTDNNLAKSIPKPAKIYPKLPQFSENTTIGCGGASPKTTSIRWKYNHWLRRGVTQNDLNSMQVPPAKIYPKLSKSTTGCGGASPQVPRCSQYLRWANCVLTSQSQHPLKFMYNVFTILRMVPRAAVNIIPEYFTNSCIRALEERTMRDHVPPSQSGAPGGSHPNDVHIGAQKIQH